MFCSRCGKTVDPEATKCKYCETPIGESRFEGVVSSISYVNEKKQEGGSSAAEYVACIDFTPDDTVRLGMTVVVYVQ